MSPEAYVEMAETEFRHWWFKGRREILRHVIRTLGLPDHPRILEVGSGTGGNLPMLASFGKVSALEMNATARTISMEKTGGRFDIRAGLCPDQIPFAGDKFDLICLFDVLEHIDEDAATLMALKDYLADDGCVLVSVPAYRWLWSAHDKFLHHRRRYSARELSTMVRAAGFVPKKITYFNTFLFPLAAVVRIKERLFRDTAAFGNSIPPSILNELLANVFASERFLLTRINLPFGVSLLGVLNPQHQ